MATEAKMGMGIVVILVCAFAFLVYHKIQLKQRANQQAIAAQTENADPANIADGELAAQSELYAEFQPTSAASPATDALVATNATGVEQSPSITSNTEPELREPFNSAPVTASIAASVPDSQTSVVSASPNQPAFPDFPSEPAAFGDVGQESEASGDSESLAALELQEVRRNQSPTSLRERVEPAFDALPSATPAAANQDLDDGWRGSEVAAANTTTTSKKTQPADGFTAFGEAGEASSEAASSSAAAKSLDDIDQPDLLLAAATPQAAQAPPAFQDTPFSEFGTSSTADPLDSGARDSGARDRAAKDQVAAPAFDAFGDNTPAAAESPTPTPTPNPFSDVPRQQLEPLPGAFADSFADNERANVDEPTFDNATTEFSSEPRLNQLDQQPAMAGRQPASDPTGLTLPRFPKQKTQQPIERTRRPEKFVGMAAPVADVSGLQDAQLEAEISNDSNSDLPFGNEHAMQQESASNHSYEVTRNFDNDQPSPLPIAEPDRSGSASRSVPVFPKPPQLSLPARASDSDSAEGVAKFVMPQSQQPLIQQVSGRGGHCEVCEVQLDDNYWTISRRSYGTARYFSALALYNQDRIPDPRKLRPGMKVLIPEPGILKERYPELFRDQQPKHQKPAGFFLQEDGTPAYRIGERETLSEISQKHLGRASRWIQIYRMNQNLLQDPNSLKPGTVIVLPDDATNVHLAP